MDKDNNFDALKELAEKTKQITEEELIEKSKLVKELMGDDEDITEKSFKKYFLPLIIGTIEPTEDNIITFLNNIKIVTGNVHRGLRVVDDVTHKELFVLPPVMLSIDDNNTALENFSFSILIRKQLLSEENPLSTIKNEVNAAMKYITNTTIPEKDQLVKYGEGILKMYKRYNIISDNTSVNPVKVNNDIGDLLDLD